MNTYIDIDTIKTHLNIDKDYCDEDLYILLLSEAAIKAVENHIDCPLEQFVDEDGQLDAPLLSAILLMIGTLYQNRETVAFAMSYKVPLAYEYLLQPYVNYLTYNDSSVI